MSDPVEARIEAIVDGLLRARAGGGGLALDRAGIDDLAMAYRVQAAVTAATGPVGGFKVARKPGQPTIMAPILSGDIVASPARLDPGGFGVIGIELEVGFLVTAALPPADAPDFRLAARDCVAAVPVIEIVDTRLAEIDGAPPLTRLADNQLNGGLVVGAPVADWRRLDLATVEARLSFDGETVLDGRAAVPGGDAFENFIHLAEMIGDHCGGIRPGHVVITGSLNGMPFVDPGASVVGRIAGLGEVAVRFDG